MKKFKILGLIILLIAAINAQAQQSENLQDSIKKIIVQAVEKDYDLFFCKYFESAIFSVVISFDTDSKVEEIIFSDSENCFTRWPKDILNSMRTAIEKLNIKERNIANQYILSVIYILPNERVGEVANNIPDAGMPNLMGLILVN